MYSPTESATQGKGGRTGRDTAETTARHTDSTDAPAVAALSGAAAGRTTTTKQQGDDMATPMMDAAGITATTDLHGLRQHTERLILTKVAEGWDFQDATMALAEHVRDSMIAAGEPEVANGMGRLVVEIGASFGVRLLTGRA